MNALPTSHRLTTTNEKHWARPRYVKLERCGRSAHRMTRATRREWRAAQRRASRIRAHRPTRPMWARALQAAAAWVF